MFYSLKLLLDLEFYSILDLVKAPFLLDNHSFGIKMNRRINLTKG